MRRLIWSEDARVEFRNAIAFIAQDSPSAARAVRHRINDATLLEGYPQCPAKQQ